MKPARILRWGDRTYGSDGGPNFAHVAATPILLNLTLIGAIRQRGWVTLGTQWTAATAQSFVTWVRRRLAPCLQPGDVVVLDNLRAHKDPRVRRIIVSRGARVRFLPPYSYDLNPIEAAWGRE